MKRAHEWQPGYLPDRIESSLRGWCEREIDFALRAGAKATETSFLWWKNPKSNRWELSFSLFGDSDIIARMPIAKVLDFSLSVDMPPITRALTAEDFAEADQFCDHIQWCLAYVSRKVNAAKKAAGLIP